METGEEGSDERLLRMLSLLTRMVSAQAKLGEDSSDELAEIADLARRRLIEAGLWRKKHGQAGVGSQESGVGSSSVPTPGS